MNSTMVDQLLIVLDQTKIWISDETRADILRLNAEQVDLLEKGAFDTEFR